LSFSRRGIVARFFQSRAAGTGRQIIELQNVLFEGDELE